MFTKKVPLEEKVISQETPVDNKKRKNDDTEGKETKRVKREFLPKKYVIIVAYVGTNYQGLQLNPEVKTIEGELLKALWELKAIPTNNTKDKRNLPWHRSCRTDQGVHALRNIITAKLYPQIVEDKEFLPKINELLGKEIKILGFQRVTDHFNAKNDCKRRTYLYYIPCSILLSDKTDFTKEDLDKFNKILKKYEGSNLYHNFTIKLRPEDEESRRNMKSVVATGPFLLGEKQYIQVSLCGSSFLYNQIRKMMGLAIIVMRGMQKESLVDDALSKDYFIKIPVAPGHCLMLDTPEFYNYDKKIPKVGPFTPLTFEKINEEAEKYKKEVVLQEIVRIDKEKREFPDWLFLVQHDKHDLFEKRVWGEIPKKKEEKEEKN